ncbi:MAG: HAD hydrolase family protein [Frankiaceae bacterium]|nr:HAD hydrolase family protein [Arenimonas sp.]
MSATPEAITDPIPETVRLRARDIRLAVFDVDGTLTDGRLYFDHDGNETKAYHVHDGLGLRLLIDNGIAVALITARESPSARARARDLRIEHVFTAVKDKMACLVELCQSLDIGLSNVAYLGDDLADLPVFPHVGLAAAPANVHPWVRDHVHWVTAKHGGEGAAREFCDLILDAAGKRESILARFQGR